MPALSSESVDAVADARAETATFDSWTGGRELASIGTNAGSATLPFQGWKHFKESFAPELIKEAIESSRIPVSRILDPFGGSGTTALASQFLGVHPTTIEVNPYLADVIRAKLTSYDSRRLQRSFDEVLRASITGYGEHELSWLPPTFVEPGVRDRYLFSSDIATIIASLLHAIEACADEDHRRLFKVTLSGVLLDFSNARVSGKGRRYRSNWRQRIRTKDELLRAFAEHTQRAIMDIVRFRGRATATFDVLEGDSRTIDLASVEADLAVFSPPYPNSFDYTDVYNIELWVLGYLRTFADNGTLRARTLTSHVQVTRSFEDAPTGSSTLLGVIDDLRASRDRLWDRRIPEMIATYFADLIAVISQARSTLPEGGEIWMVVGDSRYAEISIPVAEIVAELLDTRGLEIVESRPFRSMRVSPQQGGRAELAETLIVFRS